MRSYLFAPVLVCSFGFFSSSTTFAASPVKPKKINSQLYENEPSGSVSGKVKVVREIQEETEVFLEGSKGGGGPYILPQNTKNRAALLKILQRSQKPRGPSVTLGIDDQQRIQSVEENESEKSSDPDLKPGEKWEL